MDIIKLDRLDEHHDGEFPQELLDLTVGEMLDKIKPFEEEYVSVEQALQSVDTKVSGPGYEKEDLVVQDTDSSVEKEESEREEEERKEDDDDMPTFNQIDAQADPNATSNKPSKETVDTFNF